MLGIKDMSADYYEVCVDGIHSVISYKTPLKILFSSDHVNMKMFMFYLDDVKWVEIDPDQDGYTWNMRKYEVNYIDISKTRPTRYPQPLIPAIVQRMEQRIASNNQRILRENALARERQEREEQGNSSEFDWLWDF
jgi:hypothetical protein